MKQSELTIIIPFLNEGKEIENTLQSIRETAVTHPRIVLINDNSYDGFDYRSVADRYGDCLTYIVHRERKGVAASRDEGVELSETPYFLLLDGHMRFYEKGWDELLIDRLKAYPQSILCAQTRVLWKEKSGEITVKNTKHFGAYIRTENLRVAWNAEDTDPESSMMEIPCILGAGYAVAKSYWQYLHGLNGLYSYGMDEQLLSIKTWLSGGRCLLMKDLVIGHIYRDAFPYVNPTADFIYNKLYLSQLFLPYSLKKKIFEKYRAENIEGFEESFERLKVNYPSVKKEMAYFSQISQYPIGEFLRRNREIAERNNNGVTS